MTFQWMPGTKGLTAKICLILSQKNFMADAWLGSKHASDEKAQFLTEICNALNVTMPFSDGGFLRKQLTYKSRALFSQKNSK